MGGQPSAPTPPTAATAAHAPGAQSTAQSTFWPAALVAVAAALLLATGTAFFKFFKFSFNPFSPIFLGAVLLVVTVAYTIWDVHQLRAEFREAVRHRRAEQLANERAATYPPGYPSAWYRLCASSELRRGEVRDVAALGTHFAVFRGADDGVVSVVDAYCPHLGANMAVNGRVVGNCLECPFHQWQFDGASGACTHVPYTTSIPAQARTHVWPSCEKYGLVFVYFSEDRVTEPPYALKDVPELAAADVVVHRGAFAAGRIYMHMQEFAENTVDFQHFGPLHSKMYVPFTAVALPGVRAVHNAKWEHSDVVGERHQIRFINDAHISWYGWDLAKYTSLTATITFLGPGSVVLFHFPTPLGTIYLFQTHLPSSRMVQDVHFTWFAERKVPRALVYYVVGTWVSQWRNDVDIWENKIYLPRPVLVKGDGPIGRLRQWFNQFYVKPASLDW